MKEDIPYLSPIRMPFPSSSPSINEIGLLSCHYRILGEKSQRFRVVAKEIFNEALSFLQALENTT